MVSHFAPILFRIIPIGLVIVVVSTVAMDLKAAIYDSTLPSNTTHPPADTEALSITPQYKPIPLQISNNTESPLKYNLSSVLKEGNPKYDTDLLKRKMNDGHIERMRDNSFGQINRECGQAVGIDKPKCPGNKMKRVMILRKREATLSPITTNSSIVVPMNVNATSDIDHLKREATAGKLEAKGGNCCGPSKVEFCGQQNGARDSNFCKNITERVILLRKISSASSTAVPLKDTIPSVATSTHPLTRQTATVLIKESRHTNGEDSSRQLIDIHKSNRCEDSNSTSVNMTGTHPKSSNDIPIKYNTIGDILCQKLVSSGIVDVIRIIIIVLITVFSWLYVLLVEY